MKYHKMRANGFENRHGAEFRNFFLWGKTVECWHLLGGIYYRKFGITVGSLKLRVRRHWKGVYRGNIHRKNWHGVEP
jgi:hypothetical protein